MGSLRITFCTAVLALTALTPAAHAADGAGFSVTPSSPAPAPGTDVALRVGGCPGRTGTAVSAAFVADVRLTAADGGLVGESRVRSTLTAGSYDVRVTCGDSHRTETVTVAEKDMEKATEKEAEPAAPAPPASPTAPVLAGGGGTAHLAAVDAREAGPGTAHTVTGLVLAGVAAVAVALRSAHRSRGTD
ncbi:hypothetical protein [Streptomyces dysideae]|uniref:Sortase n=1 Tax=Streptomyces dysideae TaxID=909626 RepID=A0A101V0L7_9ACTN|nr:hypothetical protein [Streptomyces dysideae]KUO20305.1 hypothetical protein AQJ91_15065 [Streptomyces dysideae]